MYFLNSDFIGRIFIMNRSVPNIDPCGTSCLSGREGDDEVLILTDDETTRPKMVVNY